MELYDILNMITWAGLEIRFPCPSNQLPYYFAILSAIGVHTGLRDTGNQYHTCAEL
jgi:hypothetical protein